MTHWGWYWKVKMRHRPKTLCSSLSCVDSFALFKNKRLSGFSISDPQYPVKAVLKDDKFEVTSNQKEYDIKFEKQPCHFGGFRYFFRCPIGGCHRRMRKLYCQRGVITCRRCLKLGYYSQRASKCQRCRRGRDKVEEKILLAGGTVSKKPKWMRKITFELLLDRYWEYEHKRRDAYCDGVELLFGHLL